MSKLDVNTYDNSNYKFCVNNDTIETRFATSNFKYSLLVLSNQNITYGDFFKIQKRMS